MRKNKNSNKNCFFNQSYYDPSLFTFSFGWLWPIKTHVSAERYENILSFWGKCKTILNRENNRRFSLKVLKNCDLQRTFDTSWKTHQFLTKWVHHWIHNTRLLTTEFFFKWRKTLYRTAVVVSSFCQNQKLTSFLAWFDIWKF